MTDPTSPKPTRAKAPAATPTPAKATPAMATRSKAPAAKVTKAPLAKAPIAKTPATTVSAARTTAAKTPAAKVTAPATAPAGKTVAAKAPAAKAPAARTRAVSKTSPATAEPTAFTPVVPPVEVAPVIAAPAAVAPVVISPVAATAPAGWYPIAAGSLEQRYWDGTAWTQHTYDPTVAAATASSASPVQRVGPQAPEGTKPSTSWFWITAVSPVIAIVGLLPTAIFFNSFLSKSLSVESTTALFANPAYLVSTLLSFLEIAVYVIFPILDWSALRKRGVPSPFHWAWSLSALIVGSPIIYVIGRTVVARRRTGRGLAPLWVFIGVQLIAWIAGLIFAIIFISAFATELGNLVSSSANSF